MILRNRSGQNVELRAGEWGTEHIIPRPGAYALSNAGVVVSEERAYGLPAVAAVIRQPAAIVASLPFKVYREGDQRQEAPNSRQWQILHERPSEQPPVDCFQFWYDLALSLEATQNGFVYKMRTSQGVFAAIVIDPHRMRVTLDRQTGEKVFEMFTERGEIMVLPPRDVLHVRGWTPSPGGAVGVSYITASRDVIGSQLAMSSFEGDFFRRGGVPPFWFIGAGSQQQALDILDLHMARHAGSGNQHKPGTLWGSADVKSIPVSMADALYADTKKLSVADVCNLWDWPPELLALEASVAVNEAQMMSRVLKVHLGPRLQRIQSAFASDPDFFYGQPLYGEFVTAALMWPDYASGIAALKSGIQGSIFTPNEARRIVNLPPHPLGDQLQFPVVGGGPVRSQSQNGDIELAALLDEE